METLETDVLVIGAGAAGIRACVAASVAGADVVMVTREPVVLGGSSFSEFSGGWGIQALIGSEATSESLEAFYEDIVRIGLGQCDTRLVRILVEESGPRLEDLLRYGIRFRKDVQGNYLRHKGCFSDCPRAYLTADLRNIQQSFLSALEAVPVRIVTGYVKDLIVADNACWGAEVFASGAEVVQIDAKATVLATGGGAAIFRDHFVDDQQIGDGYALAHRAGAELINMEFIQFMLGLRNNDFRRFLPLGQLHQTGRLVSADGRDILCASIPDESTRAGAVAARQTHFPFSSRDISGRIDVAVAKSNRDGQKVYWAVDKLEAARQEVVHFAHAFNGGIKIDERGESTLPGLYAAGEVAAGPHGADRIGGCMMTATQVFGQRAGQHAGLRALKLRRSRPIVDAREKTVTRRKQTLHRDTPRVFTTIQEKVKNLVSEYVMVLRNKAGLTKCAEGLREAETQLKAWEVTAMSGFPQYFRVRNIILTAGLTVDSALAREESLGAHYRSDFAPGSEEGRAST
jgi:fumarate reductase (CoM/CoB) subunit A